METNKIDADKTLSVALPQQVKPTKPRRSRAVQIEDVEFIAKQVARGLTEVHAVEILGKFSYSKWTEYKRKPTNTPKVEQLFSRMKANRMSNLVKQIEVAGDVEKALQNKVRFDWRASQMLASLHDDRFRSTQSSQQNTTNQTAIIIGAGGEDQLRKLIGSWAGPAAQPAKQLPADGQDKSVTDV